VDGGEGGLQEGGVRRVGGRGTEWSRRGIARGGGLKGGSGGSRGLLWGGGGWRVGQRGGIGGGRRGEGVEG